MVLLLRQELRRRFGKKDEMTAALLGQLSDYVKSYGFAAQLVEQDNNKPPMIGNGLYWSSHHYPLKW